MASINEPPNSNEQEVYIFLKKAYEWYYIDKSDKQTKGPISLRELGIHAFL